LRRACSSAEANARAVCAFDGIDAASKWILVAGWQRRASIRAHGSTTDLTQTLGVTSPKKWTAVAFIENDTRIVARTKEGKTKIAAYGNAPTAVFD
jgi:hypothetical protein